MNAPNDFTESTRARRLEAVGAVLRVAQTMFDRTHHGVVSSASETKAKPLLERLRTARRFVSKPRGERRRGCVKAFSRSSRPSSTTRRDALRGRAASAKTDSAVALRGSRGNVRDGRDGSYRARVVCLSFSSGVPHLGMRRRARERLGWRVERAASPRPIGRRFTPSCSTA